MTIRMMMITLLKKSCSRVSPRRCRGSPVGSPKYSSQVGSPHVEWRQRGEAWLRSASATLLITSFNASIVIVIICMIIIIAFVVSPTVYNIMSLSSSLLPFFSFSKQPKIERPWEIPCCQVLVQWYNDTMMPSGGFNHTKMPQVGGSMIHRYNDAKWVVQWYNDAMMPSGGTITSTLVHFECDIVH